MPIFQWCLLIYITIYLLKKLVMTHLAGKTMREVVVATTLTKFAIIMVQPYQEWKTYLEKFTIIQKTTVVPAESMVRF